MNATQQWEYLTTFLSADADREAEFLKDLRDWKEGIPAFTPEAMIPRLDSLGEQGWELVHMQPVGVSNRSDVLVQDGGGGTRFWSSNYFCAFKRMKV